MSLPYDPPTAFLIAGSFYELLPFVAWLVLARQHNRQVLLWCGGGVLFGLALVCLSLSGRVPQWQSTLLAQVLLSIAHLSRIQSLRLDLGRPLRKRWLLLVFAGYLTVFEIIRSQADWQSWRALWAAFGNAAMLSALALMAWRVRVAEQSRNAALITVAYGLLALSLLAFGVDVGLNRLSGAVTAPRLSMLVLLTAIMLSAVIGNIGYLGLALDRSVRRQEQEAAERAREDESRRLGDQIAALDRQRSLGQLSASLGHELNQPLTAILTNAQVVDRALATDKLAPEQREELVAKIILNTQRAGQIVERIRDFIKPRASHIETVDLQRVVQEVMALMGDEAHGKHVHFHLPEAPVPVWVQGDPVQLSQVLLNVFRNAIEALAGRPLRDVVVEVGRRGDRAFVSVHDSGPGLAPEILARPDAQYLTTKASGLGMGLAISRSIARQHQGSLSLGNVPAEQGGGARVELELPLLERSGPGTEPAVLLRASP